MSTKYTKWALSLLWGLAAAGTLAILVSLATGIRWMLASGSLAAVVAVCLGPLIASQARSSRRTPVYTPEHR
jgi:hypothetical protein